MRTFTHQPDKAWIYLVSSYEGNLVIGLRDCSYYRDCKNIYKNVDSTCGGKKLLLSDRNIVCPCTVLNDKDRSLGPKGDVQFTVTQEV